MIIRMLSCGKSFKGAANYVTHDPNAQTDQRIGWTHTLNCANDHVPSAVDEMIWTARDAELLKQEAGIRAGGRATESPVKHLSLNWSPEDSPTREHMIETSEGFLKHMGWHEHQAVVVAHTDKEYAHCHILLNVIHPETGLRLDDGFEKRRAQAWALDYERENGMVYCEQRLKRPGERDDAPTRDAWQAFQENKKMFENAEKQLSENQNHFPENRINPENVHAAEWTKLKEMQRQEREAFFNGGKSEYSNLRNSIYGEVREEFRERWADYYAAHKAGGDDETLAGMKSGILAEQKAMLEARRDEACQELRDYRDGHYRDLLKDQQAMRLDLRACQEAGLDSSHLFQNGERLETGSDMRAEFRETAEGLTAGGDGETQEAEMEAAEVESSGVSAAAVGNEVGFRAGFTAFSFAHSLLLEFEGSKPITRPRSENASGTNLFEHAAKQARENHERVAAEEEREQRERERNRVWD